MNFIKTISLALAIGASTSVSAKIIQILHTNDLHSYFQGTRGGIGGYAQLKKKIDELKREATLKGIDTIYLDGGDFGEGSSFYFSNHGVDSLRALDLLGVDVTVLGNHDFILGGKELRNQMMEANLKTRILSANLKGKSLMGLQTLMPDAVDYFMEGVRLRIFGLSTNEMHFMYPIRPLGYIADPHKAGVDQATRAREAGADFTIALTHIGLEKDIALVQKTRSIDMVVGGHSHLRLNYPQMTKNLDGRMIPIVQAGAHSGYVGAMILDLQPKGQSKMLDYRMIDIKKDMPQDEILKNFTEQAYKTREIYFGRSWTEVIGFSEIKLTGNIDGQEVESSSCWSKHMARLTRETGKTDLGLQFDGFQGEQIEPGNITYGDLVDNFPHFRKWGDHGWKISRTRISGFILNKIINALSNSYMAEQVTFDGLTVKDKVTGKSAAFKLGKHKARDALFKGGPLNNLRYYTISLPAEIPYALMKTLNVFGFILFQNLRNVPDSNYWPLLETYIKNNSPLKCLED